MISIKYLYLLIALFVPCMAVDNSELRCEVCCRLVEEIQHNVSAVDPSLVVQVANFRLDGDGNQPKRTMPLAQSQMYLTEVMDSVCEKMEDYVRATFKANGSLVVMPLLVGGQMNPLMSDVNLVQDSDLNKSLQYYCEDIVNDIEDDIVRIMKSKDIDHAVHSICTKITQLCPNKINKMEL